MSDAELLWMEKEKVRKLLREKPETISRLMLIIGALVQSKHMIRGGQIKIER